MILIDTGTGRRGSQKEPAPFIYTLF